MVRRRIRLLLLPTLTLFFSPGIARAQEPASPPTAASDFHQEPDSPPVAATDVPEQPTNPPAAVAAFPLEPANPPSTGVAVAPPPPSPSLAPAVVPPPPSPSLASADYPAERASTESSAAPASASTAPDDPSRDVAIHDAGRHSSRADDVRFGLLGGVGFPRPLSIEGLVDVKRLFAVGAEYSFLPQMTIAGVQTDLWAAALDGRIFPLRGPFFVGLRAGHQHAAGHASVDAGPKGTFSESVAVDSTYFNPYLGFLWVLGPGIALGIDAGVQIPITSNTSSTLPNAVPSTTALVSTVETFGKSALPTVDLLRIGFLL